MTEKRILTVDKKSIKQLFIEKFFLYNLSEIDIDEILKKAIFCFISRKKAEDNLFKKQLIPYILIQDNQDNFLVYKRKGNEIRLHGFYSLGVGGHIDIEDIAKIKELNYLLKDDNKNFLIDKDIFNKIIACTIEREIYEELGIRIERENTNKLEFLGFINEDITSVGKVHLGLVFLYNLDENFNNIKPIDNEIEYFDFFNKDKIYQNWNLLEKWSILALSLININNKLLFISNKKLKKKEKAMFFENKGITEFIEYITKKDDIENFKEFLKFILSDSKKNKIFFKLKNQGLVKIKQETQKNGLEEIK